MTWPNFFIIGVSKAGTTSLYNYLNETENVFLIPKGKIHYFFPEEFNNDSNKEEYLSLVKNVKHEKAIGEYAGYLEIMESPKLIKETIPDAKIIISLRDPVERAFSHYLGTLRSHNETLSFDKAFEEFMNPANVESNFYKRYIKGSLYHEKLKRLLDIFGEENVLIIIFEEFIKEPKNEFKKVIEFLEIDSEIPEIVGKKFNTYAEPLGGLGTNIVKNKFVNKTAKKIFSKNARVNLLRLLTNKKSKKPELTKEQRRMLEEFYKKDAKDVERLLGKKLPWELIK
jgi:hypothetical protein